MSTGFNDSHEYRRRRRAAADHAVDLPDPDQTSCPDFTDAIMSQLGYQRISREARRSQQRRRWANRLMVCVMLGGTLLIGHQLHQQSDQARKPASMSVPQAISHDIQQHRTRLDDVLWLFDDLAGPIVLPPDAALVQDAALVRDDAPTRPIDHAETRHDHAGLDSPGEQPTTPPAHPTDWLTGPSHADEHADPAPRP